MPKRTAASESGRRLPQSKTLREPPGHAYFGVSALPKFNDQGILIEHLQEANPDKHRETLSAGRRHVQPVQAVEKLHDMVSFGWLVPLLEPTRTADGLCLADSRSGAIWTEAVQSTGNKILVIRGGAIGDFILTLPAIAALRQRFPGTHLEVLGYPHIAQLAQAAGLVDGVRALDARALAGFFARDGELAASLRDYFSEFAIVVSYLYDPDETFQTNVRRCLRGEFIQGPHRPDEREALHASQVYLRPLEPLGICNADPVPRLSIGAPPSTLHWLALHPGSGSERKNWPEARWTQLLELLVESTSMDLLLVGGEAEGQRLERLAQAILRERCELAKNLPLAELAVRMRSCVAFVGHDSGITHLAAALGLPCLVLWADTRKEIWRPLGQRVTIVREADGLEHLRVERVAEGLRTLLVPLGGDKVQDSVTFAFCLNRQERRERQGEAEL